MKRMRMKAVVAVLAVSLVVGTVRPAAAADSYAADFGMGVGTVFANLVYMPTKVVYATLGGLTGGFAFLLTAGRMDTASAIWKPSLGGTYVLTPSMLRGEDPVYFSGGSGGDDDDDDEDHYGSDDRPAPRDSY